MRIFVTGGSGWIGSALVPELLGADHEVVALARSEESARALATAGAEPLRGSLTDRDRLQEGAAESDGVIHLGFIHDFANFAAAAQTDADAIEAMGAALEGSGRPLVIASGLVGLANGRAATEADRPAPDAHPRIAGAVAAEALAARGVRSSVVRLSPTVHGAGDTGFISWLIRIARERGVSGYVDDGTNRWAAVHRLDAAPLFRLAVEKAPAGAALHGVDEEGVPIRDVAEIIGRHLGLPVESVPRADAAKHFGWLGAIAALDLAASSTATRELLGWEPTHQGLVADLEEGHYFAQG